MSKQTVKTRFSCIFLFLLCGILLQGVRVFAQDQASLPPEEFSAPAAAVDAQTILTGRYMVRLWGIEAVDIPGTNAALKGRTALDDMVAEGAVRCRAVQWQGETRVVAQCVNAEESDLGLAMLQGGYAVVDRGSVAGSVFEGPYREAESKAKTAELGIWAETARQSGILTLFKDDKDMFYMWVAGTLAIPAGAFVLLFLSMMIGFGRLARLTKKSMEMTREQEERLRAREKFVVAAMLESELMANRGKLEAFTVIYKDMLKNMRAQKEHKYQQTGEIIHEAPSLNRSVFDGNIGKLDLLGPALATEIVGLYNNVRSDPDYIMLEPDMPVEDVILKLDKIITMAEKLIEPIDRIVGGLNIILREDKPVKAL